MNLNRLNRPKYLVTELTPYLRNEILFDSTAYSQTMAVAVGSLSVEGAFPKSDLPSSESLTAGPPYWWGGVAINAGEYTTGAEAVDQLYAYPFVVGRACRLRAIKFFQRAAGAAGAVFRFGIYEARNDGDGNKPGKLLFDTGELNGDTNYWVDVYRVATCGSGISLEAGVYFWAYICGTATPTWSKTHCSYMNDLLNNAPNSLNPLCHWMAPMSYSSLPSDFPTSGLTWGGDNPIRCWFSFMP